MASASAPQSPPFAQNYLQCLWTECDSCCLLDIAPKMDTSHTETVTNVSRGLRIEYMTEWKGSVYCNKHGRWVAILRIEERVVYLAVCDTKTASVNFLTYYMNSIRSIFSKHRAAVAAKNEETKRVTDECRMASV